MVMGYWSVAILFWQLSIDHSVNVLKSYIKDVDLPRHAWDTPPFLLIGSPTPPVQSVDAYVRTYVLTLGQSRDNQTKRGWPYSMSMGLCPTRASRAREPRYKPTDILVCHKCLRKANKETHQKWSVLIATGPCRHPLVSALKTENGCDRQLPSYIQD